MGADRDISGVWYISSIRHVLLLEERLGGSYEARWRRMDSDAATAVGGLDGHRDSPYDAN